MTKTVKERVVLAPNPSALTGPGTNTILLGQTDIAVIDPGPDDPRHIAAILDAVGEGRVSHIFVTHAHLDHSAGTQALAKATGAPVLAFGGAAAGRSPAMARAEDMGIAGGGEGVDEGFDPDIRLADGAVVTGREWSLTALHTPGHMGNHLAFASGGTIYCGDLVMGWSTTLISPPDGDLSDYFRSLHRLALTGADRLVPAHGDAVDAPGARLAELAAHRRARTAQVLAALAQAPGDASTLAARIYDVAPALQPAAARNVLAHLLALAELGAARWQGEGDAAVWSLA